MMGNIRTAADRTGGYKWRISSSARRSHHKRVGSIHLWPQLVLLSADRRGVNTDMTGTWHVSRLGSTKSMQTLNLPGVETSFISQRRRVSSGSSRGKKVIHQERNSLFSPCFLNHLTLVQFSRSLSEPTNGPISRNPLGRVYITEPEWKDDIRGDFSLWKSKPPNSDHWRWAEAWGSSWNNGSGTLAQKCVKRFEIGCYMRAEAEMTDMLTMSSNWTAQIRERRLPE